MESPDIDIDDQNVLVNDVHSAFKLSHVMTYQTLTCRKDKSLASELFRCILSFSRSPYPSILTTKVLTSSDSRWDYPDIHFKKTKKLVKLLSRVAFEAVSKCGHGVMVIEDTSWVHTF